MSSELLGSMSYIDLAMVDMHIHPSMCMFSFGIPITGVHYILCYTHSRTHSLYCMCTCIYTPVVDVSFIVPVGSSQWT